MKNIWESFWKEENINSLSMRYHHKTISSVFNEMLRQAKVSEPDVIEIGCGSGELTARILENFGGSATLIDNSETAMRLAKVNFRKHGLRAAFLNKNMFNLKLKKRFDIVMSEGLIEHFIGKEQEKVIKVHRDLLKKDGCLIICVPRPSLSYRLWKYCKEKRKTWPFGYEKAMDKETLKESLEKSGFRVVKVLQKGRYSFALAKV